MDGSLTLYALDGRWWIAAMDDASRLIMKYGVFHEATAENTIHVLKQAIDKHGSPREQKQHQFKSIDEYVHWHNEVKPHLSLNIETLETPIQAFHRKLPLQKTEPTQTIQDAK